MGKQKHKSPKAASKPKLLPPLAEEQECIEQKMLDFCALLSYFIYGGFGRLAGSLILWACHCLFFLYTLRRWSKIIKIDQTVNGLLITVIVKSSADISQVKNSLPERFHLQSRWFDHSFEPQSPIQAISNDIRNLDGFGQIRVNKKWLGNYPCRPRSPFQSF